MHGVYNGDRYVNMYMPAFCNPSWKFVALPGVFYITVSNITLFKNDLLDENISLKENLENLAFFLSPNQKNSTKINIKSSKIHHLQSQQTRSDSSYLLCPSEDKRTPLLCVKCKKYFHSSCNDDSH